MQDIINSVLQYFTNHFMWVLVGVIITSFLFALYLVIVFLSNKVYSLSLKLYKDVISWIDYKSSLYKHSKDYNNLSKMIKEGKF